MIQIYDKNIIINTHLIFKQKWRGIAFLLTTHAQQAVKHDEENY